MDLTPIEIEKDLLDNSIPETSSISDPHKNFIKNEFYKNKNFYSDATINNLISNIRSQSLNKLIIDLLTYVESNDILFMNQTIFKLKEIRFNGNILLGEAEKIIFILDKFIRNNSNDFNMISVPLSLLSDMVSIVNSSINIEEINIQIDWKVYYRMFITFYGISKNEFSANYPEKYTRSVSLCEFIKKARRLFHFSQEDYSFLREAVLSRLCVIEGQMIFGLLIAQLFLPADYLANDTELQRKFFDILENVPKCSNYILLIFSKIIKNGIKISKEKLIEKVFSLSFCLLTDGVVFTYFNWPDSLYRDRHANMSLSYILAHFLIEEEYQPFRGLIYKQFKILINLISSELTENSSSDFAFTFVKLVLNNIKQLVCRIDIHEISEYDTFSEYTLLDEYKELTREVIEMMQPVICKCILYNESTTFSIFVEFLTLSNITDGLKGVIHSLFDNNANDFNFFIKKITAFIRCLMNDIERKETFVFINGIIDTAVEKISCISGSMNKNIMDFFNVLFAIARNLKRQVAKSKAEKIVSPKNNGSMRKGSFSSQSNLEKILIKLNMTTELIVKKIFQLFSFFSNLIDDLYYSLFFHHMSQFVDDEVYEKISNMICEYI